MLPVFVFVLILAGSSLAQFGPDFLDAELHLTWANVEQFDVEPNYEGSCTSDAVSDCGHNCRCIGGKFYCCRVRKDWDALTTEEKTRYVKIVFDIATGIEGTKLQNEYFRLINIHRDYWMLGIHSKTQFFPWHRIFMLKFEDLLRRVDCKVTIPYWDWTKNPASWWNSDVFGGSYFGKNWVWSWWPNGWSLSTQPMCPYDGAFSQYSGFKNYWDCLTREFSYSTYPPSYSRIQGIIANPSFNEFESDLRHEHGIPHFAVGGNGGLFFGDRSAEDPLFFIHHGNVDYQWYQRQVRNPQAWDEYWGDVGVMDRFLTGLDGEMVGDAVNPFAVKRKMALWPTKNNMYQERTICVEYEEVQDGRYDSWKQGNFIGQLKTEKIEECSKPERGFPPQVFMLFHTDEEEKKDFMRRRNTAGSC